MGLHCLALEGIVKLRVNMHCRVLLPASQIPGLVERNAKLMPTALGAAALVNVRALTK
jgi:hypothetical protein